MKATRKHLAEAAIGDKYLRRYAALLIFAEYLVGVAVADEKSGALADSPMPFESWLATHPQASSLTKALSDLALPLDKI
jgi:hypothetical protein